ncbi:MAG: hypothetical protein ACKVOK_01520 [Flavobacteriales bacterium]
MKKTLYILFLILAFGLKTWAQEEKKVTFNGTARSLFYGDKLTEDSSVEDTITVPRLNSGHVLVDLGVNIRPNKNTEIQGMIRVRNDYGGFWGSGVTFDVRQLSARGVIGGIVRYQLGDINYKMSRYTMWNYDQELISNTPAVFRQQTDLVNYDHFYFNDNSRRQQGAAAEFALVFKKYVKELQFHAVTTRVKTSDFSATNDRLFSGLNARLIQSKYFQIGVNYANLYDIPGTSRNKSIFINPVLTADYKISYSYKNWEANLNGEIGKSSTRYKNNTEAPDWDGRLNELNAFIKENKYGVSLNVQMKYVGSAFRSPGAQTKRIDFTGLPLAYSRITNEQQLRALSTMDLMRESDMYNLQIQPYLMAFSPQYDNITPYGDATPNRQGYTLTLGYAPKKLPVTASVSRLAQEEVKGEGTIFPRVFTRNEITLGTDINKFFPAWKKTMKLTMNYRSDLTTREPEELVRDVNLETSVVNLGLEIETIQLLDLLVGWQEVKYKGFDYTAIRDTYSEIYNFSEFKADGNETMRAIGLRYRFSDKTNLSFQLNEYKIRNEQDLVPQYKVRQFMLLFLMKF